MTHIVTIVIHSKFDYETNDIRIGPNIEITTNTVNQLVHCIAQDIIKSNRDTVCISRIEKISNNNIFKSNLNLITTNPTKSIKLMHDRASQTYKQSL
jgi:hypothetical protein